MIFDVFTLFPEFIQPYLEGSILKRAREKGLITVNLHNIRSYTHDKHHTTDDTPYGGGGGMIMKPEPIFEAVESVLGSPPCCPVILLDPQGKPYHQKIAISLAQLPHIALICGRYEGIDERVRTHLIDEEISIGDYVLTGGELPALVLIDSISRLVPGVLGDPQGAIQDSHTHYLLEHPHYTRPPEFRGWSIPEVLLSGNHAQIERWRREQSLLRTYQRRPDLLEKAILSEEDKKILAKFQETSSSQ